MDKHAADSPLSAGAAALKQLVKAIADSPCREVPEVPGDEDSHDYVGNARLIEESIRANLVEATGLHRDGYLRALTDALAMFADGCTPGDEESWDPIANTAAAFEGKAAAMPIKAPTPGAPFFSLNARYFIEPGSTLADLAVDVSCLLGVGLEYFEQRVHQGDDEGGLAGIYVLRQANAVFEEIQRRLSAEVPVHA